MIFTPQDLERAHKHSSHHLKEIERSNYCGCFCCLTIFKPMEIKRWSEDETECVLCPECCIDSVIGDKSGYPITFEFLKAMQTRWSGGPPSYDYIVKKGKPDARKKKKDGKVATHRTGNAKPAASKSRRRAARSR